MNDPPPRRRADEFPQAAAVADRFSSLGRAFALVRRVTGPDAWEAARRRRTEDLLVYLALEMLEPLLRVYEGCARAYLGEVEDANVIKLHRFTGKVSYLSYPEFDTDPHPALRRCLKVALRTLQLECLDYATSANPPVLHRKETFLPLDHPLYEGCARLTRQEERHGLLDDRATIGTRDRWEARLRQVGFIFRGRRLVRRRAEDDG
jgi:hypothetical protein